MSHLRAGDGPRVALDAHSVGDRHRLAAKAPVEKRYMKHTVSSSRSIASFGDATCSGTSGGVGVTRRLTAGVGESLTASQRLQLQFY